MHRATEPLTTDLDLSATARLWLHDLISEFLHTNPSGRVVVSKEDDRGLHAPFPRWEREGSAVRVRCSWSNFVLPERPVTSMIRKAMVRAGATHDWAAIDQAATVGRRREIVRRGRAVLGIAERAQPGTFLLRVDDFPSTPDGLRAFETFHAIAREHAVPYLIAVTPFEASASGLSTRAVDILQRCVRDGVDIALHGFTHVSRSAVYANELLDMPADELAGALDRAAAHFRTHNLAEPIGFIAPFNGYDPSTFSVLARRFPLVCGGPESVTSLGYRAGPSFLSGALYVPSYRGAYDLPLEELSGLDRLAADSAELPVPVTVHWANIVNDEATGFSKIRRLCEHLRGRTGRWSDFVKRAHEIGAVRDAS